MPSPNFPERLSDAEGKKAELPDGPYAKAQYVLEIDPSIGLVFGVQTLSHIISGRNKRANKLDAQKRVSLALFRRFRS